MIHQWSLTISKYIVNILMQKHIHTYIITSNLNYQHKAFCDF